MKFKVRLREMSANEIAGMIPSDVISSIKAKDPNPVFKAFVIGHEGEARGNVVGIGNVVKRWFRDAVEKLHAKISAGIQLFHGHERTNDPAGRTPIGEVVGKRLMRIGDRISSVVACYVFPSFRHLPLDVASIEADVVMDTKGRDVVVTEVEDVTGIALGNSAVDTPGFAGATLLGQLQAFAKSNSVGGDLMDLTIEDVKAFLKTGKVAPSDVFGMEDLAADPLVVGFAESRVKARVAGEWAGRKEAEEKLAKAKAEYDEKVAGLTKQISGLRIETAKTKMGPMFEAQRTSRKLDDRQAKFIQSRIGRFTPTNPDDIDKEFNTFLDSEIDEYNRIAKDVFGVNEPKPGNGDGNAGPGTGTEPIEPKDSGTDNPYLDPTKNPMIRV